MPFEKFVRTRLVNRNDPVVLQWERYWLDKYKEGHNGDLPPFNRVGGHRTP